MKIDGDGVGPEESASVDTKSVDAKQPHVNAISMSDTSTKSEAVPLISPATMKYIQPQPAELFCVGKVDSPMGAGIINHHEEGAGGPKRKILGERRRRVGL